MVNGNHTYVQGHRPRPVGSPAAGCEAEVVDKASGMVESVGRAEAYQRIGREQVVAELVPEPALAPDRELAPDCEVGSDCAGEWLHGDQRNAHEDCISASLL